MGPGHTIVTVLCDPGNGYLSKVYSEDWLKARNVEVKRKEAQEFIDAFDETKIKVRL